VQSSGHLSGKVIRKKYKEEDEKKPSTSAATI
jgi:hypothetical protein